VIDSAQLERRCARQLQAAAEPGTPAARGRSATESGLLALGWMYLDLERATAELEAAIALQRPDGAIPRAAGSEGATLPLLASMLRIVFQSARSRGSKLEGRLGRLVPQVERFTRFLGEARRGAGGLVSALPEDERVLPAAVLGRALDVATNALLVQAETDLADVAIHTGFPTRPLIARRTRRAQALAVRLWDEEHELFVSRDEGGRAGEPSAEGLLPLWSGAALRRQAERMLARQLAPGALGSPFPLRTRPALAPAYRPDLPGQGALSPLLDWLLVRGAYRYGFDELAARLSQTLLELASARGLAEAYHPESGARLGDAESSTTAALVLDLLKTPYSYPRW